MWAAERRADFRGKEGNGGLRVDVLAVVWKGEDVGVHWGCSEVKGSRERPSVLLQAEPANLQRCLSVGGPPSLNLKAETLLPTLCGVPMASHVGGAWSMLPECV